MKSTGSSLSALGLAKLVCRALDDKKAEDLRVLDVSAQSSITDLLVLATGTSEPHLRALRVELEKVLDAAKVHIVGVNDDRGSGWTVVDAFDVMIHVFTPAMREHYQLERFWKDAVEISVPKLLAPESAKAPKVAKPAKARKTTKPAKTPARPAAKRARAKQA
ncbi:MAG: ribosome silencing factor [Opitutae bacterium]|nr:ribosome silencing factor [Opitutae bacterium]